MAARDDSDGDEFTQAAAWLASARALAGEGAGEALVAALVNAMALAAHLKVMQDLSTNVYYLAPEAVRKG